MYLDPTARIAIVVVVIVIGGLVGLGQGVFAHLSRKNSSKNQESDND